MYLKEYGKWLYIYEFSLLEDVLVLSIPYEKFSIKEIDLLKADINHYIKIYNHGQCLGTESPEIKEAIEKIDKHAARRLRTFF